MATQLQAGITTHDGVNNFTRATASNVASGSLLVISAARWQSGGSAYVVGDCTKSAGTATIGSVTQHYTASPDTNYQVGLWSVLVTGAGTLTMQVAHAGTSFGSIMVAEYSGTWDGTRAEASNSAGPTSGVAVDSGNATSAGAGVFIGSMTSNSGANDAITQDGAFTLLGEDEDGLNRCKHSAIERIVATGTTDSASWTLANTNLWSAGVVVFKEAAGGGGATRPMFRGA